jgi:hypothetical protein
MRRIGSSCYRRISAMRNRVTSVTDLPDAESEPGALCLEARGGRRSYTGGSASDQSDLVAEFARARPPTLRCVLACPISVVMELF